jgi:hypothetical protein
MTTQSITNSINRSPVWRGLLLIPLVLVCIGLLPKAQAVSPAPDGGYPGGNTAEGQSALFSLTTGGYNTAVGFFSLRSDTSGIFNTAIGAGALLANVGDPSTFEGIQNTATGAGALLSNTIGEANTANGAFALFNNIAGSGNTATGNRALYSNTGGNPGGNANTAIGSNALQSNTAGSNNIGVGAFAGQNLTTGDNNIYIGSPGVNAESNTIRLGGDVGLGYGTQTAAYIAGINGQTASGGVAVFINSDGKLGTLTSSARFKTEIKPMDKASEMILALKPVTFRYKQEIDPKGIPQFGLVAEEVEKVNSDLVVRDREGKPYSVRYEAVNAMLLNEFLKEHREVAELKSTVAEQRKGMEAIAAQLKEQAAQIQKVSSKLAKASPSHRGLRPSKLAARRIRASGPTPQLVNNP